MDDVASPGTATIGPACGPDPGSDAGAGGSVFGCSGAARYDRGERLIGVVVGGGDVVVGAGDARGIANESSAARAGALGVVVGAGDAPGIANESSAARAGALGVVLGRGDAPGIANESSAALAAGLGVVVRGGDAPGIANESSALDDWLGFAGGAVCGSAQGSRIVAADRDAALSVDDRGAPVIGIGRSSSTIPPASGPRRGVSRCAGVLFGVGAVTGRGAGAALRAAFAAALFASKRGGSVGFLT